jgi:hypothetical protein
LILICRYARNSNKEKFMTREYGAKELLIRAKTQAKKQAKKAAKRLLKRQSK